VRNPPVAHPPTFTPAGAQDPVAHLMRTTPDRLVQQQIRCATAPCAPTAHRDQARARCARTRPYLQGRACTAQARLQGPRPTCRADPGGPRIGVYEGIPLSGGGHQQARAPLQPPAEQPVTLTLTPVVRPDLRRALSALLFGPLDDDRVPSEADRAQ